MMDGYIKDLRDKVGKTPLVLNFSAACIVNKSGEILLQKRHHNKHLYPGRWDLSVTGHIKAEEAAEEAALRELKEVVGIVPRQLKLIHTLKGSRETNYEFIYLFSTGKSSDPPKSKPFDVESSLFVDAEELSSMVKNFPELLTPGVVYFWQKGLIFNKL